MTQDETAEYATWTEPGTSFQVHYSLPVFHEIDLAVSDGYRRIPHGGIEVGGLLLGRRFPTGVRIEAFRLIECEHALGPSFKLSERDLSELRALIEEENQDLEVGGLETLGWFIAHTRGPLQLTEAEAQQFDDLLPGSEMLTVLVKPEKFKPTLFAFLVRGQDGTVTSTGADQPVILPLPGRAGRSPSTAPAGSLISEEPSASFESQAPPAEEFPREPVPPLEKPADSPLRPLNESRQAADIPPPVEERRKPEVTEAFDPNPDRQEMWLRGEKPIGPPPPPPFERTYSPEPEPERFRPTSFPRTPEPVTAPFPAKPFAAAPPPVEPILAPPKRSSPEPPVTQPPFEWKFDRTPAERPLFGKSNPSGGSVTPDSTGEGKRSGKIVMFVFLAAILGSGVGYWIYRQIEPAIIPLTVEPQTSGLIVGWPPEQTKRSPHVFVRVNDGQSVELADDAKSAGKWQVQGPPGDLKVEIIAKHPLQNSRGIVRYIQPAAPH